MSQILVVDDEPSIREMSRIMLSRAGYDVTLAEDGEQALKLLKKAGEESFDLVLSDLQMPGISGIDVLKEAKKYDPSTQVLLITAHASITSAVEAMRAGAYDYIEKPFKRAVLLALMEKALEKRTLLRENFYLKRKLQQRQGFGEMIGQSKVMQHLFEMIRRTASVRTTILISGESGVGKELVAKAFHQKSGRKGSFVAVNCGAIPEHLIESELFGHTKGSFTGAQRDKVGLFAAADQGTLFLDEVGELPANVQVKLLRILQERRVQPIGSTREIPIDVRVIAATNRDLAEEVKAHRFREDLYYRLNVIQLRVPPLRERREDISLLIQHFLEKYNKDQDKEIQGISAEATQLLLGYNYPGNIRELQNIIERAVALEIEEMISVEALPSTMIQQSSFIQAAEELDVPEEGLELEKMVARLERSILIKALRRTKGNRTEAAKLLKISFRSIRYRLEKYNITDDIFRQ